MANKIKVKLIMELHAAGVSRNTIADTRHMGRNSVSEVIRIAQQLGISADDVRVLSEEEAYQLFYPNKFQTESIYQAPDYDSVHEELSKTGVTLKTLWKEYCDKCKINDVLAMGYTRFCEGYRTYTVRNSLTNHLEHKPGAVTEVDWSGPTMSFIDGNTGEEIKVYLFVATLPYSMYSYVEPTLNMKMDTWIRCNVHMFEYFGGVTTRIVCDNLKTGVVSHPREGEIILTEDYEAFGNHYVTAIMPAQVRKPKQKASVEGTVGNIATAIIAKLRNRTFTSFAELKTAVEEKLNEFNRAPFQKREGSRQQVYEQEKTHLRPLPDTPYEIASWDRKHKVGLDFHVIYKKNRYSVPYQYAKQYADLRVTDTHVEIYINGQRVTTHQRFPSYIEYKHSTKPEHMPPEFLRQEWDDERIKRWADSIGPNTRNVIDRIFGSYEIKEQGYNPTLSVLRLSKTYSQERLETACELALKKYRMPRYHHLKALLSANQDKLYLESKVKDTSEEENSHLGYLRGAEYYGGSHHDR